LRGSLEKNKKGYKLTLHFWGTHSDQKFKKQFGKKDLHLAPGWIAACLHEWVGFKDHAGSGACLPARLRQRRRSDKGIQR
jgi:hypothetical protein